MSKFVKCPECGRPVLVPDEAEGWAIACCPLCEVQFSLGEAAEVPAEQIADAAAVPAVRPREAAPAGEPSESETRASDEPASAEREPGRVGQSAASEAPGPTSAEAVDRSEEQPSEEVKAPEAETAPAAAIPAEAEAEQTEQAEHPQQTEEAERTEPLPPAGPWPEGEADDPLVRSPAGGEPFRLSQLVIEATGEPLGEAVAAEVARRLQAGPPADRGPDGGPVAFDFLPQQAAEAGDFDFSVIEPGQTPTAADRLARPTGKQKSVLRELVGIVLGGVAGLAIAYYGLNFFGKDERFNFLNIYLPGVEHTAQYRPDWWPQWGKAEPKAGEGEARHAPAPEASPDRPEERRARTSITRPDGQTGPPAEPSGDLLPGESISGPAAERSAQGQALDFSGLVPQQPSSDGRELELPPSDLHIGLPQMALPAASSQSAADLASKPIASGPEDHSPAGGAPGALAEAIAEAGRVIEAWQSSDSPVMDADGYSALCRLGQLLAAAPAVPAGQSADVEKLLRSLGDSAENVRQIARLAAERMADAIQSGGGVLLAGKVEPSPAEGATAGVRMKLASVEQRVELFGPAAAGLRPGDRVLVLGAVQGAGGREGQAGEVLKVRCGQVAKF